MLTYKDFEEKTIVRNEIFHGKIIDVVVDDVALPNGGTSKRELVFHPGGVAVIAVTEENKMIFVRQFRKPLEKVILEIPAGKIDPALNCVDVVKKKWLLLSETKRSLLSKQTKSGSKKKSKSTIIIGKSVKKIKRSLKREQEKIRSPAT